jgi:hypothetical protein
VYTCIGGCCWFCRIAPKSTVVEGATFVSALNNTLPKRRGMICSLLEGVIVVVLLSISIIKDGMEGESALVV